MSYNFYLPAYPQPLVVKDGVIVCTQEYSNPDSGFTKLEKAALMIASGLIAKYTMKEPEDQQIIAELSVQLAKTVLLQANRRIGSPNT